MTCIAWDGHALAGDRLTNFGGLHATTCKVRRIHGDLVGGAGSATQIEEMQQWLLSGGSPALFPPSCRDPEKCAAILVVRPDGTLHQYENSPFPLTILNPFWAIGSGRDFAMAAMHCGKTASEAVEIASLFDVGCGNGVDTLVLELL